MKIQTGSTVIPALRYRDALSAIDWLIRAFGLQKKAVYLGPDNATVLHAELTLGTGMIMLGSVQKGGEFGKQMAQPEEIGLRSTGCVCVVVPNPDAVYATAKTAGATITIDIADQSYGGRSFTCRDLEGHSWNIGSYDPWTYELGDEASK